MHYHNCHFCNGTLKKFDEFQNFLQVTSDCRPWKSDGHLAICRNCGAVQKPVCKKWQEETNQIYSSYQIYYQSAGAEQTTFDQSTGTSESRSKKIVQWLESKPLLTDKGKLLDFGCGNGAFLRAFNAQYPKWRMAGLELDDRNKQAVESIPGVKAFYSGKLEHLEGTYDLVVLVHALEHIPFPVQFLKSILKFLNPGGLILLEVPDLKTSPFDILIADHCTHYTLDVLQNTIESAGLKTLSTDSDFIPKELTLIAEYLSATPSEKKETVTKFACSEKHQFENNLNTVENNIAYLKSLLDKAKAVGGQIGIFGTSISATWLAASLGDKVSFFVDEDPCRIGKFHMDCKIFSPSSIPYGSNILLPMRHDIAKQISLRLKQYGTLIIPYKV